MDDDVEPPDMMRHEPIFGPTGISCCPPPTPSSRRWIPYKHSNGVAIYYHDNPDDADCAGGEYMVSSVVRGTPADCLKVLMDHNSNTTILGPATFLEVSWFAGRAAEASRLPCGLHCCALSNIEHFEAQH